MNRRATLSLLLGKSSPTSSVTTLARPPVQAGLEPYDGEWTWEQAAHLLRRCTFGATRTQIQQVIDQGMADSVAQLIADNPLPDPPVNYGFDDPLASVGETWVDKALSRGVNNLGGNRRKSLASWLLQQLHQPDTLSIREKMTLFWHNHFVIEQAIVRDSRYQYRYINLLRENALGNFRELAKEVTIDPAMLRYLNGRENNVGSPNENYARELLELFTIGKGPQVGPGDYTNYTETDIVEIAKVLTGWVDRGYNTNDPLQEIQPLFLPGRHDETTKQLSYRFNNITIPNGDDQEYAQLIDIIFQQDEVARFISRKLYRWLLFHQIDDQVEANIIQPMAQLIIDNDYEIKPAIEALLSSAHFYDPGCLGGIIKSPIEFYLSIFNQFQVATPTELEDRYLFFQRIMLSLEGLEMRYLQPPSVSGWAAYYQAPMFYQLWINSATLPKLVDFTKLLAGRGFFYRGERYNIDVLSFVASLDHPEDPVNMIRQIAELIYPQELTPEQNEYLMEVLLPGLPEFEWTVEYQEYLNNPTDENLAKSVEDKLRELINAMLFFPEFYLI